MDVSALRLFVEVARQRSFAAVARDRGIDPSLVSRSIAALEAQLGVRLFQRTTRAMELTEAGAHYFARLPALVEELDRLRDEAAALRAEPVGVLRLTASVAFGQTRLVPLLPLFQESFPRLTLELILTDANLDLIADRIDLAIRLGPSLRADLVATRLFATRYHVVASPAYLASHGRPEAPDELAGHKCLLLSLPDYRSRWLFRGGGVGRDVQVGGTIVISTVLALRSAALAGLGPALLPSWLVGRDMTDGQLIDLFPEHEVAGTSFETAAWLLYPSARYLPRKTRSAIAFLKQNLHGQA